MPCLIPGFWHSPRTSDTAGGGRTTWRNDSCMSWWAVFQNLPVITHWIGQNINFTMQVESIVRVYLGCTCITFSGLKISKQQYSKWVWYGKVLLNFLLYFQLSYFFFFFTCDCQLYIVKYYCVWESVLELELNVLPWWNVQQNKLEVQTVRLHSWRVVCLVQMKCMKSFSLFFFNI